MAKQGHHWLMIGIMLLCILPSCKKAGCTYAHAVNYQSNAQIDDGSCLFCDSSLRKGSQNNFFVSDTIHSSPYFRRNVVQGSVFEFNYFYKGGQCASLGLTNSPNVFSHYNLILANIVDSGLYVSGILLISPSLTSTSFYYTIPTLYLAPGAIDTIYIGAVTTQSTSFSLQISSQSIKYH